MLFRSTYLIISSLKMVRKHITKIIINASVDRMTILERNIQMINIQVNFAISITTMSFGVSGQLGVYLD